MLYVFAKTDSAGMRANGHSEFRSHQQHCEHFVDSTKAATVDLAVTDSAGLQELFEHYTVMTVFPCRYANRAHGPRYSGVSKDVVGGRGLFNPDRLKL